MKILLLNPPGAKVYLRDSYCANIAKARYLWPPFELVCQSGILSREFDLCVLDAIAIRLTPRQARSDIVRFKPDAIISLVSSLSWEEDLAFLRKLKSDPDPLIVVSGDLPRFEPEKTLRENAFLDAVLLDPFSPAINQLVFSPGNAISGISYRKNGTIIAGAQTYPQDNFSLPLPRYQLFPIDRYHFPFGAGGKWGITIPSFGCPYQCSFCNTGRLGYKLRGIDNLMEELRYLQSIGIANLLFRESSSTNRPEHAREIMERMIAESFHFNWICQSRPDTVSPQFLRLMKAAGCSLIMFGIESGNETVRQNCKMKMPNAEIISLFQTCRETGIQTLAHFVLGLPGDNREAIAETIQFARNSKCDFASFNILDYRPGASLPKSPSASLAPAELKQLQAEGNRKFYFRPGYLLRRGTQLKSAREFLHHLQSGLFLLWENTISRWAGWPLVKRS